MASALGSLAMVDDGSVSSTVERLTLDPAPGHQQRIFALSRLVPMMGASTGRNVTLAQPSKPTVDDEMFYHPPAFQRAATVRIWGGQE